MSGLRSSLTGYIRPELFVAGVLFPSLLWMLRRRGTVGFLRPPSPGIACWAVLVGQCLLARACLSFIVDSRLRSGRDFCQAEAWRRQAILLETHALRTQKTRRTESLTPAMTRATLSQTATEGLHV